MKDDVEKDSFLAFLGDELSTFSVNDNSEIVELMEEYEPDLVASDVGMEQSAEEFTKAEQELKEEGHVFTPNSHREKSVKRLEALKNQMMHNSGLQPEFIRFEPQISARELAVDGDEALKSYGLDVSDIGSAGEFDAALGCVTGRFYQENQYVEHGVVVPEAVREEDPTESDDGLDPRA